MIELVEEDGRTLVVMTCHHCGQRIQDYKDGLYFWETDAAVQPTSPPMFAHERCHPGIHDRRLTEGGVDAAGGLLRVPDQQSQPIPGHHLDTDATA